MSHFAYTPFTFEQLIKRKWTDKIYTGVEGQKLYREDYKKLQDANIDRRLRYDEMHKEKNDELRKKLIESIPKDREAAKNKCGTLDLKCHLEKIQEFFKDAVLNIAFGIGAALVVYFVFKKFSK